MWACQREWGGACWQSPRCMQCPWVDTWTSRLARLVPSVNQHSCQALPSLRAMAVLGAPPLLAACLPQELRTARCLPVPYQQYHINSTISTVPYQHSLPLLLLQSHVLHTPLAERCHGAARDLCLRKSPPLVDSACPPPQSMKAATACKPCLVIGRGGGDQGW
jgi:hypothetical protein